MLKQRILNFDTTYSQKLASKYQTNWWQSAGFIAHLGDGQYVFGILALLYIIGWFSGVNPLSQASFIIALIVLGSLKVVAVIKFLVRRQRPYHSQEFVAFNYDIYSFPSGHSARLAALAVATIRFNPSLGISLGCIAFCVALARVVVGVHYLSDILVGLSIGVMVALTGMQLIPLFM